MCGCGDAVPEPDGMTPSFYHTLRWDLAMSYYFSGYMMWDWTFFCCQWHPILGIIFSHPNHPWTKKSRLLMWLLALQITMLPSAVLAKYGGVITRPLIIVFVTV